ncbi:hypothetical protein ACSSS7_001455 [Eimeria intestinalis]
MLKEEEPLRMVALLLKLLFLCSPSFAPGCFASRSPPKPSKRISSQSGLEPQQNWGSIKWSSAQKAEASFPLHQRTGRQSSTWEWLEANDALEEDGSPDAFAQLEASPSELKETAKEGGGENKLSELNPNTLEDNPQEDGGTADDPDAAEASVEGPTPSSNDSNNNSDSNNTNAKKEDVESPSLSSNGSVDFSWDLTLPEEADKRSPPVSAATPTTKQLMEQLKLDLQEKLVLHHSSKTFYAEAQRSGTMTDLPQSVTGKLCNRVLVRVVKEPSVTATFFSSVMARLGTAFNRLKAAGKIIFSKLMRLFKSDSEGGAESKAVKWIKKMASAAWVKMRGILKTILTVVVRFLPMILFIVNLVVLGMSISSFAAAPNPLSLLGVMSTVCCLVSFIFSNSIQVHTKKITEEALSERSEIGDLQLFGLSWASLRAEEDLQRRAIHKNEFGEFEELIDIDALQREEIKKREAERRSSASRRPSDAGSESGSTQAASSDEEEKEKPALEKKSLKRKSSKDLTPEELERRTKQARRRMLERIRVNRVEQSFKKAKSKFKRARKTEAKPAKKIWNLAKTSVRLLAESLNFGLHKVLQRFGRAWEWAINVGLRRLIRFFRMLTLYVIIAAWFERFVTVLKWLAGQGKFYFKVFDTLRGSASFLILNADKISALVKGTIQVSASLVDHTVFVALLLNALTKPIYGLYFALQGMKEDTTRSKAMKEFESNRKAFTNFLLGSAAVEGDIGYV